MLALLFFGGICVFILVRWLIARINRRKDKKDKVEKVKVNKFYIKVTIANAIIGMAGFFIVYFIIIGEGSVIT